MFDPNRGGIEMKRGSRPKIERMVGLIYFVRHGLETKKYCVEIRYGSASDRMMSSTMHVHPRTTPISAESLASRQSSIPGYKARILGRFAVVLKV